jgi:hypothetical protein
VSNFIRHFYQETAQTLEFTHYTFVGHGDCIDNQERYYSYAKYKTYNPPDGPVEAAAATAEEYCSQNRNVPGHVGFLYEQNGFGTLEVWCYFSGKLPNPRPIYNPPAIDYYDEDDPAYGAIDSFQWDTSMEDLSAFGCYRLNSLNPTVSPTETAQALEFTHYTFVGRGKCKDNQGWFYNYAKYKAYSPPDGPVEAAAATAERYCTQNRNVPGYVGFDYEQNGFGTLEVWCYFSGKLPSPRPIYNPQAISYYEYADPAYGAIDSFQWSSYMEDLSEVGCYRLNSLNPTVSPTETAQALEFTHYTFVGRGKCIDNQGRWYSNIRYKAYNPPEGPVEAAAATAERYCTQNRNVPGHVGFFYEQNGFGTLYIYCLFSGKLPSPRPIYNPPATDYVDYADPAYGAIDSSEWSSYMEIFSEVGCYRLNSLNPTVSPTDPNPTVSSTETAHPSVSSLPSNLPTMSLIPSSSYMPTIDCVPLTIGYFAIEYFAIQPPTLYDDDYYWSVTDSKAQEVWGLTHSYTNTSTSNLTEHTLCLPPGSYTFGSVANVPYILSSRDGKFKCGFGPNINYTFTLSKENGGNEGFLESGCAHEELDQEIEIEPLQCYFKAIADFKEYWSVDYDAWFGDEICGPLLADACSSRKPMGFNDLTTTPDIEGFCVYHQCAYPAYLSEDDQAFYGCQCQLPIIDQSRSSSNWYDDATSVWFSNSGNSECCQDKTTESNLSTSCSCYIIPLCEDGDIDMCDVAGKHCCAENSDQEECNRNFLNIVCDESIRQEELIGSNITATYQSIPESCINATDTYCENLENEIMSWDSCKCSFYEPLCSKYPGEICIEAAEYCCGGVEDYGPSHVCYCDFYSWAVSLGWEEGQDEKDNFCKLKAQVSASFAEEGFLRDFYIRTNGDNWINNTGWADNEATSYCDWFGVSCNDNGQVSALVLVRNNQLGPMEPFPLLLDLEKLELANNKLSGAVDPVQFYSFQKLVHIDLSHNNLQGEIDALLSASIEYADFSYNKFIRIATFKLFRSSHKTLRTCDLSHNSIDQAADEIFANVPPNLKEFILSDNKIRGTFPSPLDLLPYVKVFRAENNELSGPIPDFVRSFTRLKELNLSNQKLSGSIPEGLSNLLELSVLDLSGNSLEGHIPPDVGALPRLTLFNISNNNINGQIPQELGRLVDAIEVFDVSNNMLSGSLPSELGQFVDALVMINGNQDM